MDSGKRKIVAIALVAVLVIAAVAIVLVSGIGKQREYTASVTDGSGVNVTMSKVPERIVSGAPDITEVVCSLGLADKLVAVTNYDDYPAEAKALRDANKTIGGFYTPNFEKIISYNPDLVILDSSVTAQKDLAKQLRDAGYTVVMTYAQADLDYVYKNVDLIGKITGAEAKAGQIISEMKTKIAAIGTKVSSETTKPTVMYITYAESGFTNVWPAGKGTAIDQIITLAGGVNAFPELNGFEIASEELLKTKASSVDVIVMTIMYSGETPEELSAWFNADPIWKDSPAVKNNNVYFLTGQGENVFNRQSVRMVDAVQLMAEMLHPDAFSSKVPHEANGANIIGDEYEEYLTSGTSSQSTSVAITATGSRD